MRKLRFAGPPSFFFQAEDGIRGVAVTGVQTCALPIFPWPCTRHMAKGRQSMADAAAALARQLHLALLRERIVRRFAEIGRASCRERVEIVVGGGSVRKEQDQVRRGW